MKRAIQIADEMRLALGETKVSDLLGKRPACEEVSPARHVATATTRGAGDRRLKFHVIAALITRFVATGGWSTRLEGKVR